MTPSRRRFLAAAGTAPLAGVPAVPYRIDCQSHLFAPELLEWMEKRTTSPYVQRRNGERWVIVNDWSRRVLPKHTDVAAKVADMDAAAIEWTVLSINDPGPELFATDALAIARMLNDYVASVVSRHPRRFLGLAVLPMQRTDATLAEFERAVKKLGMKGLLLYSNIAGRFPDEPEFLPIFELAERLDVPVLLHPAHPVTFDATKGYSMEAGLGLMFDTTIALTRIILAGILDRFPKLKLVCPHVGGALPYLIGRIDHQTMVLKRGAQNLRKPPSEYLRQIYLDAVSPVALAIRYGYDFVGPDRMLYASDHPWVDPGLIAGLIAGLRLPSDHEARLFRENARRLFRI